ncbi:MAG: Gfo/Idh/MocA family oxidoreductase [Chloroflexi bacterium]|nr:MAG: Gfo/Idh/MocA family oxidoreductase [Chloroflexota bacterium]
MSALRVVQVGLGGWGRDWAWRVNPAVDEIEVVGYVDSDPEAAARLAALVPGSQRFFGSLHEALEATRPDAALITTTLAGHAPLSRAALDAGLHVLVEKPFTETLDAGRELVDLAARRGLTLMVSQNYRFFPAARAAARVVEEGSLGELYSVSIDFRRNAAAPPRPRARHHSDAQPLLVDMSIHHFDLLRMILGREPSSISCLTSSPAWSGFDGPPSAMASILFDELLVSYRASWISAGPITPWAGEWAMEFERGQLLWSSRGDEGVLKDRVVLRPRRGKPRVLPLQLIERIDRAGTLTEFAHAVHQGREPETSGRDNLQTLAFTFAAVESAANRKWVAITSNDAARRENRSRSGPRS